jgi:hypothetical protein
VVDRFEELPPQRVGHLVPLDLLHLELDYQYAIGPATRNVLKGNL